MSALQVNWEAGTYSAEKTPPKQFDPIPTEINGKAPIDLTVQNRTQSEQINSPQYTGLGS